MDGLNTRYDAVPHLTTGEDLLIRIQPHRRAQWGGDSCSDSGEPRSSSSVAGGCPGFSAGNPIEHP